MPYKYNNSRVAGIWIDEDLLYEACRLAEELGYRSFSEFVRDLLVEAVEAGKMIRSESKRKARERIKTMISGFILRRRRQT